MAKFQQPDFLPSAFAANGDANVIPADNDGTAGLASFSKGFPLITQQPLAQGGLPPQRMDFNGIFKMITSFLCYIQNGGMFAYANTQDYIVPSFITYNGNLYKCVKENGPGTENGVHAPTDSGYWSLLVPEDIVASVSAATGQLHVTKKDGTQQTFPIGRVTSVTEESGTVTVTKEDGSQETFKVLTSVNSNSGTGGNVTVSSGVIAGNVSNVNSWWVKLGGTIPLIIQGGTVTVYFKEVNSYSFTLPIGFSTINASTLVAINVAGAGSGTLGAYVGSYTTTTVNIRADEGGYRPTAPVIICAIGY